MRKLFFLVVTVLFFGCESIVSEKPSLSNIKDLFVNSDANGLYVGFPVKLWVELDDTPRKSGWKFDFVLNGDVVETINADQDGSLVTFYEFTPTEEGVYEFKGVLYNDKNTVSDEMTFLVVEP